MGEISGVSIIGILNVKVSRLMDLLIDVGERARVHYCGRLKAWVACRGGPQLHEDNAKSEQ
jgi:hypothetical protein